MTFDRRCDEVRYLAVWDFDGILNAVGYAA
jgi:hypothetical protein